MGLHRRSFWLGVPLGLCWAAGAGASPAQSAQEPAPPVFGADVALVAVPVFVTDKSGKAVRGLSAEDFEVYDGGRRVPIAAFQAIDVDVPVATASPSVLPVAVQAAAHRQFLLLFDLQFSPAAGILRARAAAMRFVLDSLGPSDLVAVATFGSGGLKMLTDFTGDRACVVRAIAGLGVVDAVKPDALGLSGELAELASPAGAEGRSSGVDAQIRQLMALLQGDLKKEYVQRVDDFLASIGDLALALSSLRGRKQIVLLSGGFSRKAWGGPETEAERFEPPQWMAVQRRMDDAFRMAGRSDVVIHSVSLAGLEGPVDVSSRTGRSSGRGEGLVTLAALAENTGGR
ncbi:MAG TPA: VWA domain-containing protein, partial [Vicinamibacteria bacterium]|nr:VWA domain-containing protein [Vicinamibacteria bacterium]